MTKARLDACSRAGIPILKFAKVEKNRAGTVVPALSETNS
jgi:hypothetical protein